MNQNVAKDIFRGSFFKGLFCRRAVSQVAFFLDVWTFWYFRWRMLNLVFKKSLDNFFYSRNLQFLSEEIAISRLANPRNEDCKLFWSLCNCLKQGLVNWETKCLNILFLKNNQKQNWLEYTSCKLQWRSLLNISLSIIISWNIPF